MKKAYLKIGMKLDQGASEKKPASQLSVVKPMDRRNTKMSRAHFMRDLDFETLYPTGVQIMAFSEEEIEKLSVIQVKKDEKEEMKGNFEGTLSDNRMYPHGNGYCSTCFFPKISCPGHLGYIQLVRPIINIWFYKYVVSILESICHECGSLLMNIESAKRISKGHDRLKKIARLSKNLTCRNQDCPNQDQVNPTFIKKMDNMLKIQIKYPNNNVGFINSTKIHALFSSITIEELEALGFPQGTIYNIHPKNLIFTKLPVIPENHRPISVIDGDIKKNNLTSTYHKIIEINNLLKNGEVDDRKTLATLEDNVCSIHYRDSENSKIGGNPNVTDTSKNVKEILSRKKGLIRSNAMANRCDHTGRTVIGPGGHEIPFGWIRLPEQMKKILVNERICDKNIKHYEKEIEAGNVKEIVTKDRTILSKNRHQDFILKKGMMVRRTLQEGDPIIFNRNPTLHKHSMMGYLVKFGEGLTIGIHSSCTTPHNADFDGDEANIHSCPNYHARAEIIHISGCWNNVIGSQFSRPMMGLVFNSITSAYLMSYYGVVEDSQWDKYMNTIFDKSQRTSSRISTLKDRALKRRPNDTKWKTGPTLFSALLPENFYYNYAGVLIQDGILIKGRLTKKHVGPSVQSIVHILYYNYGKQVVSQFLSEGQHLMDSFIEHVGFTVGYRDCSMPADESKVRNVVDEEMKKTETRLHELLPLMNNKNYEIRKFYNESVQGALDKVEVMGNQIVADALSEDNALKIMADCGSKGKVNDIAIVIGIVGQQYVRDNKRPSMNFNKGSVSNGFEGLRFLPYYDIAREGKPEKIMSRGFSDRPLGKGMRPGQFFSHMMASRIGLIDTALGTATTGYSQHYITKALEDMRYGYNGTICGDRGQIIQYAGGNDSYDSMEIVNVNIPGFGKIWSPIDIGSYVDMLNNE